jgi:hypothetical protein
MSACRPPTFGSFRALVGALALAFAVVGGGAACSDDGDDPMPTPPPDGAMPRQTITENVPLEINETIEAIMVGGLGDNAHLQLTVPSLALDWNIHGHAGGGTQIVSEGFKQMTVDYLFSPSADADWYLLLRNKGQTDVTVQLKIDLYGDITWSGWQ